MKKVCLILVALALTSSCKEDDPGRVRDENYNPDINADNFVDAVTNPFFPLTPGTVYQYKATTSDGLESTEVTVLQDNKTILGVKCTIVHDVVSLNGVVIEDTYDWYAQDKDGNVWYMGEDVSNYENGKLVDKDGSFEAGVDEAKPGIIMLANPVIEFPYRQEYAFGIAEDWGKVVTKNITVTVTFGTFTGCIKTVDWNALEPDAPLEFKYYAPGIGIIKEEKEGGGEVSDLISFGP